jgi:hypothetical protein
MEHLEVGPHMECVLWMDEVRLNMEEGEESLAWDGLGKEV